MKQLNYVFLTGIIFYLFSCENIDSELNHDNNLTQLDSFIINNYTWDAKQLYFNEIISDSSHENYYNSSLNETEIEEVLKIIQAVYDLNSAESDTVFNIYQIHGFYCYSFNSIMLKVKTEQLEIKNLSEGIIPTGDEELDSILSTYHIDSVKTFYGYPDFPWLTIYTKDEYNMIPIEKKIDELPQILIADFNKGCVGDGMNITLERNNNSATITFSIGSGDCPAGCIYHKYWEFEVIDGGAEFIRTYED